MRTACLIAFDKVVKTAFNLSRVGFPPLFLENQKRYIVGSLLPNAFGRVVKTPFYVSRAKFWQKQFFWEKIFCLLYKFSSEFIQTSNNCRVLSKKFRISCQKCTLPVQIFVLGGKRFAGVSKIINLIVVELNIIEQLRACFSMGLSKMPFIFSGRSVWQRSCFKNF